LGDTRKDAIRMTYNEWMNEIENYSTRYDRFLEEWDNGMSVERMQEWLKASYDMGLEHKENGFI
jgi:hypothetical protein